jgi:iron complex outermembrane recepter protein
MARGSHLSLKRTTASLAVIAALTAVDAAPALSQLTIEEITVTTRKRAENLQDIPLVIKALTADTLERKGLNSIDDIARLTPGLQFDQGTFPQAINIVIRGLSPTLGRPNVGLLLDGVDVSSESVTSGGGSLLINPRLFDMERVEVVKGPQSALFGRSAFAGAINYITKKPTNEWEGKVSLQGGQRNDFEGSVGLYGPVVEDKFLIGVNASVWNFDGYYDNSVTGADLGDQDGYGLATSMIFNFNEDVSFTGRIEYTDDHLGQAPIAFIGQNTILPIPGAAIGTVISPQVPTIAAWVGRVPDADGLIPAISEDPTTGEEFRGSDREIFRVAGTLDWDLGFGTFTSVTHYADAQVAQAVENTRQGSLDLLNYGTTFRTDAGTEMFSQELRIQSNDEDRFRWLVGGLYWEETVEQDTLSLACTNNQILPFLPFVPCGPLFALNANEEPSYWLRDTEHWSVFAMAEYDLTEQLTLHVEGRYTDEKLLVSGPDAARLIDALGINPPFIPVTIPPATGNIAGTDSDSYFTPRVSIEYAPTTLCSIMHPLPKGRSQVG